ncbi:conserved hypothetical protein [Bacillus mycoides]|uniref:XRE family transcriptional regulator n=1 Tax=Bacillus mycoides TaxID=1405 RepID=A0A653ZZR2_BACMY|nr:conserved hypothetical protein [Bacillus mycoides]
MPKKLTEAEVDVKRDMNESTRERYLAYKERVGCTNSAFAVRVGFSRCIIQKWLAGSFDFSQQSCEHMQFYMGCVHDSLTVKES